jgi:hypothetical protein
MEFSQPAELYFIYNCLKSQWFIYSRDVNTVSVALCSSLSILKATVVTKKS